MTRRPIQFQILLPMLLVVVLAVSLSSAISAWLGSHWARTLERTRLQRLALTLKDASFPLTENVLRRLSGLTGAELVLLSSHDHVLVTTLPLNGEQVQSLGNVPQNALEEIRTVVSDCSYLVARVERHDGAKRGSLVVLYPEELARAAAWEAAYPPLLAGSLTAAVAIAITAWLTQRFVQPIERLQRQTAGIAAGQFEPVPLEDRNDELRDLAMAINRMVGQLAQYEDQIRRNERLKTLGQLGAGIAHQLRNSATGARMALEFHDRELPTGADRESLTVAVRELTLMESYVQRLLRMGTEPSLRQPVVLADLVDETLSLVRPACRHAGIALEFDRPPERLEIHGDVESLRQMLLNLLRNAIDALGATHDNSRRIRVGVARNGARTSLSVSDTGRGPDPALVPRLFEPFVTDKPEGTGLGLAVVRKVAEEHAATVGWDRRDGMTRFHVTFPAEDSQASHAARSGG